MQSILKVALDKVSWQNHDVRLDIEGFDKESTVKLKSKCKEYQTGGNKRALEQGKLKARAAKRVAGDDGKGKSGGKGGEAKSTLVKNKKE